MFARNRAALALFGFVMIGADDCNITLPWDPGTPGGSPPPPMPYCLTDPPVGCAAVCVGVGVQSFTDACSNIEAGPLTVKFEMDVSNAVATALDNGIEVCPAANLNNTMTPCMDGITPVEWPNQDHAECTPAPPGCPL